MQVSLPENRKGLTLVPLNNRISSRRSHRITCREARLRASFQCGALWRPWAVSRVKRVTCSFAPGKRGSARDIESGAIEEDPKAGIARFAGPSRSTNCTSELVRAPAGLAPGALLPILFQWVERRRHGEASRLRKGSQSCVDGSQGSAQDIETRAAEGDPSAGIARFACWSIRTNRISSCCPRFNSQKLDALFWDAGANRRRNTLIRKYSSQNVVVKTRKDEWIRSYASRLTGLRGSARMYGRA